MNSNKKFEPQNNTGYLWHSQDESKVLRKGSITLDDGNSEEKKYVAIVKTTMGDKEKYELFVAAGQIFLNTEKRSEKSPDISGNIQIDGVKYKAACWKAHKADGDEYTKMKVSVKNDAEEEAF